MKEKSEYREFDTIHLDREDGIEIEFRTKLLSVSIEIMHQ